MKPLQTQRQKHFIPIGLTIFPGILPKQDSSSTDQIS